MCISSRSLLELLKEGDKKVNEHQSVVQNSGWSTPSWSLASLKSLTEHQKYAHHFLCVISKKLKVTILVHCVCLLQWDVWLNVLCLSNRTDFDIRTSSFSSAFTFFVDIESTFLLTMECQRNNERSLLLHHHYSVVTAFLLLLTLFTSSHASGKLFSFLRVLNIMLNSICVGMSTFLGFCDTQRKWDSEVFRL